MDKLLKLEKKQRKKEIKEQKKALKAQEKKERLELEEAYMQDRLVEKEIYNDINAAKRQAYIEEMKPIWEERKRKNEAPHLSILEEIGNAVSHGVGAILTVVALILLLMKSDTNLKIIASIVYCTAMFFMFFNSCLYHSWRWGSTVKRIWRRFDYSAIYLLIGGTFAPLFLIFLEQYNSTLAITLFILQWVVIIFGITMNGVFGPGRIKVLNYIIYFAVGWSGIVFIPFFINYNITLLIYILVGGIVYTLGMIPFAFKKIKVTHFIFHLVILIACVIQFSGIFICLYL